MRGWKGRGGVGVRVGWGNHGTCQDQSIKRTERLSYNLLISDQVTCAMEIKMSRMILSKYCESRTC